MFKLYSKLRKRDWALIVVIIGLTILQVYCTMTMVDYISNLISSITYLNYHNNPSELPVLESLLEACGAVQTDGSILWSKFTSFLEENSSSLVGLGDQVLEILNNVATASTGDIWYAGGMMILVATGSMCCQILIAILASYITANLATDIRKQLNERITNFSLAEINRFTTASLVTRATNDIEQVSMCTTMVLRMFFAAPITCIWAICKISSTSYELPLAIAIAIVIMVAALALIMAAVIPQFKIMQKRVDKINSLTQENLTGIRVVRAFNAEGYQEDKFKDANVKLTKSQLFTGRVLGLMSPVMTIIMNTLSLAIYWLGANLINAGNSNVDYATLASFSNLALQIVMSFMMLLMMFILWPRASVSAKRINEVLETEYSIVNPEEPKQLTGEGTIEFRDVSFRYPDAEADILEHISFKAKRGQTIAFIGPTGSGKSTLVNLVTRLYDVTEGEVLIDGVNIKDVKQADLRKNIGFVPQRGLLFSGTIRSNVGFGVEEPLTDEECQKACDISCASEFISKMPGHYDAPIAQGGNNVSGGQRQRLCIARAVAINPEILVFDDSFSALDFKTDKAVRENLRKEENGATKLIVAQRIGTIMDADQIVVLQEGKMVGIGTHQELLKTCETYRSIALSQLSKEELGL